MFLPYFFMVFTLLGIDHFSDRPTRSAVMRPAVVRSTRTTVKAPRVPYGPEPMCGGTKEAGDRWCY